MENAAINISLFVTSLQIENTYALQLEEESRIQEYRTRIESTVKKLDSLIGSLARREVDYKEWGEHTSIVLAIRNTIGIYTIFSDEERRASTCSITLWEKEGDHYTLGVNNVWQPWLGDKGIVHLGGKVVVSLSDTGIEYLNSIWEGVSSLSSSYDDTTAVTI
jgi:hypothetical protein